MKKIITLTMLLTVLLLNADMSFAGTHGRNGKVTPKSIGAGALSLLIWPGIGQLMNDEPAEKCGCHALLGLTGIFRIWSCYDAVVDRKGGVWENRI